MQAYLTLLRSNRQFRVLWCAQAISQIGDWLNNIAVLSLGLSSSSPGGAVASVIIARTLPSFLIGPIAGVVADRFDRRRVMIVVDILRAGVALAFLLAAANPSRIWIVWILTMVLSLLTSFYSPAFTALVPMITAPEDLRVANSFWRITRNLTLTLGSLIGASLIAGIGYRAAFTGNAVSFALSALMVSRVVVDDSMAPGTAASRGRSWVQDLVQAAAYLRGTGLVLYLMIAELVVRVGAGAGQVLVPMWSGQFADAKSALGWMYSAYGMGDLVGALIVGGLRNLSTRRLAMLYGVGIGGFGFTYIMLARTTTVLPGATLRFLMGIADSLSIVSMVSLIQSNIANEYRGRVYSFETSMGNAVFAISSASAGLLLPAFDFRRLLLWSGALISATAVAWVWFARRERKFMGVNSLTIGD